MSAAVTLAQFGETVSADFDASTMTIEMEPGYSVSVGPVAVLPRATFDKMTDALAFVIRSHDQLTPADVARVKAIFAEATGAAA